PDRIVGRRFRIEVLVALLRGEPIGVRGAADLGQSGDAGGIGIRGVEEDLVADLHLIAHEVAGLVVADAFPTRGAVALEVVDRVRGRLAFHQPMFHAADFRWLWSAATAVAALKAATTLPHSEGPDTAPARSTAALRIGRRGDAGTPSPRPACTPRRGTPRRRR